MPRYGVEETDSIDMNEVTENGYLPVFIKDGFRNTWSLNKFHMLNSAPLFFVF